TDDDEELPAGHKAPPTSLDGFYVALGYGNNWLGSPSDVGEAKRWFPSARTRRNSHCGPPSSRVKSASHSGRFYGSSTGCADVGSRPASADAVLLMPPARQTEDS